MYTDDVSFSIVSLPNQVKWNDVVHHLRKTFDLTFDHELTRFDPTGERKRSKIYIYFFSFLCRFWWLDVAVHIYSSRVVGQITESVESSFLINQRDYRDLFVCP